MDKKTVSKPNTSESPCPFCGKKKWETWDCHPSGEWIKSQDIDDVTIVDWRTWEMFYLDGTHVDICLSCGAQVQG